MWHTMMFILLRHKTAKYRSCWDEKWLFCAFFFTVTSRVKYEKIAYMSRLMTKPAILIRVFAVRSVGSKGAKLSLYVQRRIWSDWADAHADLSLWWAHTHFVGFILSRLIWTSLLTRGWPELTKSRTMEVWTSFVWLGLIQPDHSYCGNKLLSDEEIVHSQ